MFQMRPEFFSASLLEFRGHRKYYRVVIQINKKKFAFSQAIIKYLDKILLNPEINTCVRCICHFVRHFLTQHLDLRTFFPGEVIVYRISETSKFSKIVVRRRCQQSFLFVLLFVFFETRNITFSIDLLLSLACVFSVCMCEGAYVCRMVYVSFVVRRVVAPTMSRLLLAT